MSEGTGQRGKPRGGRVGIGAIGGAGGPGRYGEAGELEWKYQGALLSPKSSERLVRHARARIPNDVRAREGDYFVGSRAPQTQGRKGAQGSNEKKLNDISGESRQEPTHISALLFWVAQRGLKSSLRISPVCAIP